jgi:hypothetical protein
MLVVVLTNLRLPELGSSKIGQDLQVSVLCLEQTLVSAEKPFNHTHKRQFEVIG